MYKETHNKLEKFDNHRDFERMCADILNGIGYKDVVPIAPKGGGDGGKDITFGWDNEKGLACVTLRKDINKKFYEDFRQRKPGEYDKYYLFCTASLTKSKKEEYEEYCRKNLKAEFVPQDIEALRSLLDGRLQNIRDMYLKLEPIRANPQLNVSKAYPIYSKPDSDDIEQGAKRSWFLKLRIENTGQGLAKNCFGQVLEIKDEKDTYLTQFNDMPFYWEYQNNLNPYKKIDIAKSNSLDIAQVEEKRNTLIMRVFIPGGQKLQGGKTLSPGIYCVKVGIYSDNAPPVEVWVKMQWKSVYPKWSNEDESGYPCQIEIVG